MFSFKIDSITLDPDPYLDPDPDPNWAKLRYPDPDLYLDLDPQH